MSGVGCHPRHAEAVGEWTAGLQLFLRFAVEHKAIGKLDAELFLNRMREQLFRTLPMQAEIQDEADPGTMFLELIRTLLSSKRRALCSLEGLAPNDDSARCGWQRSEVSAGGGTAVPSWDLAPAADRIGWIDDGTVYLDPNASYAAAERLARQTGQVLGSRRQVSARLAETGRIRCDPFIEGKRRRFTRRVVIENDRKEVLCLPVDQVFLGGLTDHP